MSKLEELYSLINNFYGYKCQMIGIDSEKMEVNAMLYNAFYLKCNINDRYGRFGAGISFGVQEYTITEFLGRRCSLNNDEESIKKSLQIIDEYCRLRLPDKFLDAYYRAYVEDE